MSYSPAYHSACREVREHFGDRPHAVCVLTFGCQQNEADSEKLRGIAADMGYRPVDTPEEADLVIFNTCAIREHAEQKVLSYLGGLKKQKQQNPDLLIGVAGCMTAQEHRVGQLKTSYPYVSFTLDPASLPDLPRAVAEALRGKRNFHLGEECPPIDESLPTLRREKHRAWVSIMYGCNNFCSYCIVPYVRGRERSRMSSDIIGEVEALVADGCREITLLGQNVNSYRGDCDFATLLRRIAYLPGDFTVRFMTSHPKDVPDDLIRVMTAYPDRIVPHFHLPLQSGSDEILRRMNRRYTAASYLETVEKLRAAIPHIALTTDIIVGFPGETEEDFEATLTMLKTVGFEMAYTFLYSPRQGTPAARMEGQIDSATRADRMARLLALQDEICLQQAQKYVGKTLRILVDGRSRIGARYTGRTPANKPVHFLANESRIGTYVNVRIDRAEAYAFYGTWCD